MGYERKRGKLADLNALLRGDAADRFAAIVGDTAILRGVRYVITLDTDTQLPRDAARQLVGAMAHPLNRAVYDSDRQRVREGYGILQPRVAVSLPGANRSRYARLHGSDAGIDPYTHAVSDVYQDWFQEGSFIGKGIYDVDVFEQALKGRFPENRILSHDLLEGCYARSGLLSDVQLYEDFPACYGADSEPPVSLDSRRLADCAMVAATGSRCRWTLRKAIRSRPCRAGNWPTISGAVWCPPP
jgi:cyclic beta-1,2-glucan synthetase